MIQGTVLRNSIFPAPFVVGLAALTNVQASAETIPATSLPAYEKFRLDLLRSGWVPDYNYGAKLDDGSPMYHFPEVVCGNRLCSAQWIGKTDRKRVVIVLWMDAKGGYVVAPQVEYPE